MWPSSPLVIGPVAVLLVTTQSGKTYAELQIYLTFRQLKSTDDDNLLPRIIPVRINNFQYPAAEL